MDIDLQEEYRAIGVFYDRVEPVLALPDDVLVTAHPEVSGWSPAQHLFHILRANGMMLKGIQLICQGHRIASDEGEPNKAGRILLARGRFPRGAVRAPDPVQPPEVPSREELLASLARSRQKYDETEAFLPAIPNATGRIQHVYLGMLNAAEWLRLVHIHSDHHLAIIHEIVAHREAA